MCTSPFWILMPIFYTREQSCPENHGNICALTPGDALKLRGTCSFPVSGSTGVLVLQGKTTEFPKTVLFLGVMWLSFCFLSLSVEKLVSLNLENFIGRMRSLRGHHVWSDHDETINLNNLFLSQSCEVSWGCRMKKEMTFGGRVFFDDLDSLLWIHLKLISLVVKCSRSVPFLTLSAVVLVSCRNYNTNLWSRW